MVLGKLKARDMPKSTLNLRKLNFLVADANPFSSKIVHSILRNFTAESVFEAKNAKEADEIMCSNKVDALLCDHMLPGMGGVAFAHSIRQNAEHPCRCIPILVMAGETRPSLVKAARDAGAHLVVRKPIAPAVLFDRLLWIAYRARRIVEVNGFFGPDRRFKFEAPPEGRARRKDDAVAQPTATSAPNSDASAPDAEKAVA